MVPKDSRVPIPVPGICEYVTIHSKGGIVFMAKSKILSWRVFLVDPRGF